MCDPLGRVKLSWVNLSGVNLSGVKLSGVKLSVEWISQKSESLSRVILSEEWSSRKRESLRSEALIRVILPVEWSSQKSEALERVSGSESCISAGSSKHGICFAYRLLLLSSCHSLQVELLSCFYKKLTKTKDEILKYFTQTLCWCYGKIELLTRLKQKCDLCSRVCLFQNNRRSPSITTQSRRSSRERSRIPTLCYTTFSHHTTSLTPMTQTCFPVQACRRNWQTIHGVMILIREIQPHICFPSYLSLFKAFILETWLDRKRSQ